MGETRPQPHFDAEGKALWERIYFWRENAPISILSGMTAPRMFGL
eukprot:XP_001708723.1 Hypothetical protein GL50803_28388 [Giardia lamblia ATCC 50803]